MVLGLQAATGRWSTNDIHDTVAAIARQPMYATPLRQSLAGRLFGYVFGRLSDFFALLRGSPNARVITVAAVILAALVITARIAVAVQIDASRKRAASRARGAGAGARGADFWVAARELHAAGDHAAACHALYAAVLDALARDGAVKFHASKTSGDYVRELRRRGSPAADDVRAFARQFDHVIYGATSVSAEDYESLARAAEQAIRSRLSPPVAA